MKVRRFALELQGEADCDLENVALDDALRRWKPHLVTVGETDAARKAIEERLMIANMPKGRAARFRASVGLALAPGEEPLQPAEAVATLLQALLLSPKTNLLGTWALEEEVKRRIAAGEHFGYLYLDIDNFKPFNDTYGVAKGDEIIGLLAEEVERAADQHGTDDDICAHIGGDDFAVVTTPDRMEAIGRSLMSGFDARVPAFYSDEHRTQGGIEVANRRGQMEKFPLMTVSVAAVDTRTRRIDSFQQLCDIGAELKAQAKMIPGSTYMVDRRRDQEPAARRAAT